MTPLPYTLTPAQRMIATDKTRKAELQMDGKTLRFYRLDRHCKGVVWLPTRLPVRYRCKSDAVQAKEAWEERGEFLNNAMERVM